MTDVRVEADPAVAELIGAHLPLVRHIVFQVAVRFPRHVDREELVRAGTLGLVEAAHRYSEARGVPFNRFAAQRIRGAILDGVRSADWAPRSVRTLARTVDAATHRLTGALGRVPNRVELARAVGVPVEELARLEVRIDRATLLGLDHPVGEAEEELVTLGESICGEGPDAVELLERRELHAYLRAAVRHLPERHRLVVVGYFLEDRSSTELAALLGVTVSRISQIRSEALRLLREVIADQYDGEVPALPVEGHDPVARRRAARASAVAASATWRERLAALPGD